MGCTATAIFLSFPQDLLFQFPSAGRLCVKFITMPQRKTFPILNPDCPSSQISPFLPPILFITMAELALGSLSFAFTLLEASHRIVLLISRARKPGKFLLDLQLRVRFNTNQLADWCLLYDYLIKTNGEPVHSGTCREILGWIQQCNDDINKELIALGFDHIVAGNSQEISEHSTPSEAAERQRLNAKIAVSTTSMMDKFKLGFLGKQEKLTSLITTMGDYIKMLFALLHLDKAPTVAMVLREAERQLLEENESNMAKLLQKLDDTRLKQLTNTRDQIQRSAEEWDRHREAQLGRAPTSPFSMRIDDTYDVTFDSVNNHNRGDELRWDGFLLGTLLPAANSTQPERKILLERKYARADGDVLLEIAEADLNRICRILSRPDEAHPGHMRTLRCVGYLPYSVIHAVEEQAKPSFLIAYDLPLHEDESLYDISTLYDLLKDDRIRFRKVPLEQRLLFALRLARTVYEFFQQGILHKGLRSPNILVLGSKREEVSQRGSTTSLCLEHLYVIGFESSRSEGRPELSSSRRSSKADHVQNLYRHPNYKDGISQGGGNFKREFELYSLGIILCEVALWEAIDSKHFPGAKFFNQESSKIQRIILSHEGDNYYDYSPLKNMAYMMGSGYQEAVKNCFVVDPSVDCVDWLSGRVVAPLEACISHVMLGKADLVIEG